VLLVDWAVSEEIERVILFGIAFLFLFNSLSAFVYVRFGRFVAIIDNPVIPVESNVSEFKNSYNLKFSNN